MSKNNFDTFNRKHTTPDFQINSRVKIFKFAYNLIPKNKRLKLCFIILSLFINSLLSLLRISLIEPIIYLAANKEDFFNKYSHYLPNFISANNFGEIIFFLSLIFAVTILIKFFYVLAHNFVVDTFTVNLEIQLAHDILSDVNKATFLWTVNKNALVIRDIALTRSSEWARGTVRVSLNILGDLLFLLMAFFGILFANLFFGTLAIVLSGIIGFLIWNFIKVKLVFLAKNKIKFSRLAALSALDISSCGRELRFLGREETLLNDYHLNHKRFGFSEVMAKFYKILPKEAMEVTAGLILILFVNLSFFYSLDFNTLSETLILIVILSLRALPIVSKVVTAISALEANFPSIAELSNFMNDLKSNKINIQNKKYIFQEWKTITFQNINFFYEKNRGIDNVTFNLKRKENICLVGDTGAGKTTLVDILCGLLNPQTGTIKIDEINLSPENAPNWTNNIIYVPQNPIMIDASIKENIVWGKKNISDDHFNEVLKISCLDNFVNELKNKEHTIIGDNGKQISGGQKQRIAIARALFTSASLIIFDESTNALDNITESKLLSNLIKNDKSNRSLVFISHRLSLAEKVDKVIFVKNSKVIEVDEHLKLMKRNKPYRELIYANNK